MQLIRANYGLNSEHEGHEEKIQRSGSRKIEYWFWITDTATNVFSVPSR
jgi:hypothetical protein